MISSVFFLHKTEESIFKMHKIYGIRHHGPGSTRALLRALQAQQPDLILIEGPPDADNLIEYVVNPDLKPPVALLLYNPKDLNQAVYYPFAQFSPEWQAMKFALQKDIPVRFMDLPQAIHFGLNKAEKENIQIEIKTKKEIPLISKKFLRDPLGEMAKLAGYEDSERWWEVTFEQNEGFEETFDAILEMMQALRNEVGNASPRRELMREAFMRKTIRDALKKGNQNIAVVCGAWHAPVLQNLKAYKTSSDNALLKGLKKIKPKATWIPWSYDRLARQSGYSAGVQSPAWYNLLFAQREEVVQRWMTQAARLLREQNIDISAAHAIEAVRLSETLAAIRALPMPGIQELFEAANTVFGGGDSSRMDLIEKKLIVGDVIGQVPSEIPVIPLQQDLEQRIKKARLTKERNTTEEVEKKLDLRKESNFVASHLLHRLLVLNIPWGRELAVSKYNTGSFSENWQLKWMPEFIIKVIEAGMWGNTVGEAATSFTQKQCNEVNSLSELTSLLGRALKADLKNAIPDLIQKLQNVAAVTKDVFHLMDALYPLVAVQRYGSTRKLDLTIVKDLIQNIIPRICIGLPNACVNVDEEVSQDIFQKLIKSNQAISLLNDEKLLDIWLQSLYKLTHTQQVNGLLKGACSRILFDKKYFDVPAVATQMRYALSKANDRQQAVFWMEGFLHGSGLLLIHNPILWQILDDWIDEIPMDDLMDVLPLLRRTFSKFSTSERQKMLALAQQDRSQLSAETIYTETDRAIETVRAERVLPTIRLLLGQ